MMKRSDVATIYGAVILPCLGETFFIRQMQQNSEWYSTLKCPWYKPPIWMFTWVWASLYFPISIASILVWKQGGGFQGKAKLPLALYASQLALNFAWCPIFSGRRDLKNSAIEIVALTVVASATGFAFHKINRIAGLIFIPYVTWLSFTSLLNYKVFKMNPDQNEICDHDSDIESDED